MFEGFFMRKAC